MNFGDFLGNEGLKARLSAALAKGQLSHSYLITGPQGSGRRSLALRLAAAAQCGAAQGPCGSCPQCRKVFGGVHPDVITVDEPEKKTVPVQLVRQACADLYVRPNEGRRKIYLFPRAEALNAQGQNALLKCMEEPPAYGMFLLLCEHPQQLLATVLSRCVHLQLAALPRELLLRALAQREPAAPPQALEAAALASGGFLGRALELLAQPQALLPQTESIAQAWCHGSPGALLRAFVPLERLKREQLLPILQQCCLLFAGALEQRGGAQGPYPLCRTVAFAQPAARLYAALDVLREAIALAEANVGVAHICGALAARL